MSDPYSEWLDIPAHLRPPTYYQLLGILPSELDPHAIAAAADGRLDRLRTHEAGPRADESRRLAREVVQAREVLLDPVSRLRYDTLSPDAADPWWKPDAETPPLPPTGPVEGWWEGEAQDGDRPAPAPPVTPTPPPLPPPPATTNDWWKPEPGTVVAEPPPLRTAPPPPPAPVTPPPPPVRPAASPAAAPVIHEQSLTYAAPQGPGSAIPMVLAGLFIAGLAGGAILYFTKPWAAGESSDDKTVAEHKSRPETGPVTATTGTTDVTVRPAPTTTVAKPAVTTSMVIPVPSTTLSPPPKNPPPDSDAVVEAMTFRGHKGGVFGVAVSRSGKTILSVSDDRGVLNYSPQERGKHGLLHKLGSPGVAIVLCNDDRDAIFCDGGEAVVYDLAGRKVRATFENPRGGIRSLAAAPDGSFVLTGTTDGVVRWWNPKTKALDHMLDVDAKATVTALAVTPDARTAALGLSDGRLALWDLKGRREIKRWPAHKGAVTALACSPDGQRVVSGGEDGVATVWQPGGTLVRKLSGHEGPVTGVAWCSDGKRVVTVGVDRSVRLWAEEKGWKADRLANTPDKAFCLALDARDRFAVVGQADGAVQLLLLPKAAGSPGDVPGP